MHGPVEFSEEALRAFQDQTSKCVQPPQAVRLGVRGGACNGLQYVIEFDYDAARPTDVQWTPDQGSEPQVRFRIDKKSVLYLTGSRVTWSKNLMKEGFEFENPNEQSRCGCGHSFSTK